MKRITNVSGMVLAKAGIGEVKQGESREVPDDMASDCATAPRFWYVENIVEETKKARKKRDSIKTDFDAKEMLSIEVTTNDDDSLMEDNDNDGN